MTRCMASARSTRSRSTPCPKRRMRRSDRNSRNLPEGLNSAMSRRQVKVPISIPARIRGDAIGGTVTICSSFSLDGDVVHLQEQLGPFVLQRPHLLQHAGDVGVQQDPVDRFAAITLTFASIVSS